MRKQLLIFGNGDMAEVAHYYFSTDSKYEVIAFTVDAAYRTDSTFCNLPLVDFEKVSTLFSPKKFEIYIAIGYSKLNEIRKDKYLLAKSIGYKIASYISPHATVLNEGDIGENCLILEKNVIQPFVTIGNNVTLFSGNQIGHHSSIKDHCYISTHVAICGRVEVGEQCFIGANATLRDNIIVGERCVIGAGTLLLNDAEPDGVYIGKGTERKTLPSSALKNI